ncbi:MAG: ferredoxin-type protein NapF [Cocleimonas sp.]|nr:ferredoxin-type protein NapF [Cocleimonas sp.]
MTSDPDLSRRFFLRGKVSKSSQASPLAIRPPWAQIESLFIESCSRCGDCISACSQNIIIKGDGGFPEVSFKQGECTFCTECIKVCETGALDVVISQQADQNAWDLNVSIQSNCLSLNAVVCRACGDNCETQAIQFKLKVGGISEPLISQDDCTGCGACVAVCPVDAVSITSKLAESIAA